TWMPGFAGMTNLPLRLKLTNRNTYERDIERYGNLAARFDLPSLWPHIFVLAKPRNFIAQTLDRRTWSIVELAACFFAGKIHNLSRHAHRINVNHRFSPAKDMRYAFG